MSIGGLSNVRPNGNSNQGNQGAGANGESSGKEFSLEKQQAGALTAAGNARNNKTKKKQTTEIVDRSKKNRKGAPRTIIVDGDIYEVFLMAIA
jgi:hypothetical protein